MVKKHVLLAITIACLVSFNSHSQTISTGTYKLYYTEFKNYTKHEEFFYLKIDRDHSFEIVTPYVLNEFPLADCTKTQNTFKGKVEQNNDWIVFNFLDDGELPGGTPYFGPPQLEIKIRRANNTSAEYFYGTISVMCVIRSFYFRFEPIKAMPLDLGFPSSTTKLLKTYVDFGIEISRRIKSDDSGLDHIYNNIIGKRYKIGIHDLDTYWFTVAFYNRHEAEVFFESKEEGMLQSTDRQQYYVYYNHDGTLEIAFRHCMPTEWGYYILTEPVFEHQEIRAAFYYMYYGGDIPRSGIAAGTE